MPRKIRQLLRELGRAGFVDRGGRGSHRNLVHPKGVIITVRGKPADDAPRYLEREVKVAIEEARRQ